LARSPWRRRWCNRSVHRFNLAEPLRGCTVVAGRSDPSDRALASGTAQDGVDAALIETDSETCRFRCPARPACRIRSPAVFWRAPDATRSAAKAA
jgi:hypothetical protein